MMQINKPHGYLLDSDGRVVLRFGNWSTGEIDVPDPVADVEYVNGPDAHTQSVHNNYKIEL